MYLADGVAPFLLDLIERVGFCPFEHEVIDPGAHQQRTIGVNSQQALGRCPKRSHVAVASCHIKIGTREVALPLVSRLPNRDKAVGSITGAFAHLCDAICVCDGAVHNAYGVVALASICCCICRVKVEEVLVSIVLDVSPPTVCPDVFDVHVAYGAHVGIEVANSVAVAVANLHVFHLVCLPEAAPSLAYTATIVEHKSWLYKVVECFFELCASKSFSLAIVLLLSRCKVKAEERGVKNEKEY